MGPMGLGPKQGPKTVYSVTHASTFFGFTGGGRVTRSGGGHHDEPQSQPRAVGMLLHPHEDTEEEEVVRRYVST